jgi:hypothetical protein
VDYLSSQTTTSKPEAQVQSEEPESESNESGADGCLPVPEATPWLDLWQGYAPLWMQPGLYYPYTLYLRFGCHSAKTVVINGPKLTLPHFSPVAPDQADGVL